VSVTTSLPVAEVVTAVSGGKLALRTVEEYAYSPSRSDRRHRPDGDEMTEQQQSETTGNRKGPDPVDPTVDKFQRSLDGFDQRVAAVRDDQWQAPTPCSEWDVRALVGHVTSEQLWAPSMLAGRTMAEVGDRFDGDVLGDDPRAAWREAAAGAREAAASSKALDGMVHVSYGDVPAERYLTEMTLDAVVHAWDLARATGGDERLDPELVELALALVEPNLELLAASGLFGAPLEVPAGADPQTRLLALLGRRA
jgi:uncharacterized protein (TIGR03086 family)